MKLLTATLLLMLMALPTHGQSIYSNVFADPLAKAVVGNAGVQSLSLNPSQWWEQYNVVLLQHPSNGRSNGVYFTFPFTNGNDEVNYLYNNVNLSMSGSLTATFNVTTTGAPVFNYQFPWDSGNTCSSPAKVRFYFERKGSSNGDPTYRWWANPIAFTLTGGSQVTLTVPLTPDQWSDTNGNFGTDIPVAFNAALADTALLGFSFGGGCFFGHGVSVGSGTATFTLLDYEVIP